jgi:hypothetical protein
MSLPCAYTFDQVWQIIDGEKKSSEEEIFETLQKEIDKRSSQAATLYESRNFESLTKVESELNSFIQTQYGLGDLTYRSNGEEESDVWKAAWEKGNEIRGREDISRFRRDPEPLLASKESYPIGDEQAHQKKVAEHIVNTDDPVQSTKLLLGQLEPGQKIVFRPTDGKIAPVTGHFISYNEESLTLKTSLGTLGILLNKGSIEVVRVEPEHRHKSAPKSTKQVEEIER